MLKKAAEICLPLQLNDFQIKLREDSCGTPVEPIRLTCARIRNVR